MKWVKLKPSAEDLSRAERDGLRDLVAARGYHARTQVFRVARIDGYSYDPVHHTTIVVMNGVLHGVVGDHRAALDVATGEEP